MDLVALRTFFMWCTAIDAVLLIVTFLFCAFGGSWIYRMHSRWFAMPRETFNVVVYGFLGIMKMLFVVFNLVPYLALLIMG